MKKIILGTMALLLLSATSYGWGTNSSLSKIPDLQKVTEIGSTTTEAVTLDGMLITNDGTTTDFIGTSGDYNRIGDAGTTAHSIASEDDLMVTGKSEVTDTAYFDGELIYQTDKYIVVDTYTSTGINAAIDALGVEGGEV